MYIREFTSNIDNDKEELPFDIEDDVAVYMRNDPMFYRKYYYPAVLKMQAAHDSNKSIDGASLWTPIVQKAVMPYISKFKIDKDPNKIIDKNNIKSIASNIYSFELGNIKDGSYK